MFQISVPTIAGSAEATRATARSSTGPAPPGTRLREGHATVADLLHGSRIDIVHRDLRPPVGERDRQRQAHASAAADDHDVALERPVTLQRHQDT